MLPNLFYTVGDRAVNVVNFRPQNQPHLQAQPQYTVASCPDAHLKCSDFQTPIQGRFVLLNCQLAIPDLTLLP